MANKYALCNDRYIIGGEESELKAVDENFIKALSIRARCYNKLRIEAQNQTKKLTFVRLLINLAVYLN